MGKCQHKWIRDNDAFKRDYVILPKGSSIIESYICSDCKSVKVGFVPLDKHINSTTFFGDDLEYKISAYASELDQKLGIVQ